MVSSSVAAGLAALIVVGVLFNYRSRFSLSMIRGPKSPSFIFGNLLELYQRPVGETEFAWQNMYGDIVRFKGILGDTQLLVADPKALQKMLNTSAYDFPKLHTLRIISLMINGRGITWSDGEDHKRHKNVMLPGFGVKVTKALFPIFQECAESLSVKWLEVIGNSSDRRVVIDVHAWLSRGTLDAVGRAAFDVQFNTIENDSHPLAKSYSHLFSDIFGLPPARQIFAQAASKYIPTWMMKWMMDHSSNPRFVRARRGKRVATGVARELVQEKADALLQGKGSRDVLTLLVKANMDTDAKNKLNEEELLAQMSTILLAGHETTAGTIGWILLELARNPAVQSRLRDEIRMAEAAVQARDDPQLTVADLDGMTYLNAVIKEGLRLHSVVPHVQRIARQDDVLPLSKPIHTRDGRVIDEILVPKGTQIQVSIAVYNRDKDLWGKDAHEFNPDRWLGGGAADDRRSTAIGVYANLLTFLSGTRACLGWRFALVELQAFVAELVGKFEFATTDKTGRIVRQLVHVMAPMVDGELDCGVQLPLAVSPAQQDAS